MPIKIPNGLPAAQTLAGENIFVMDETRAVTQDIRPLQILVLNLMPTKIETETQLSRLLGNTPLQVELEFLHTSSHESKNTAKEHLFKFYQVFDQVKDRNFDGMVVTGAPVEQMPFEDVEYWPELCEILEWSKTHVYSTFHICWGAQAGLYYHYGIRKYDLPEKLFGVFPHAVERRSSMLMRGFDDTFMVPFLLQLIERELECIQKMRYEIVKARQVHLGQGLARLARGGFKLSVARLQLLHALDIGGQLVCRLDDARDTRIGLVQQRTIALAQLLGQQAEELFAAHGLDLLIGVLDVGVVIFDGRGQVAGQDLRCVVEQRRRRAAIRVCRFVQNVALDERKPVRQHGDHVAVLLNVFFKRVAHQTPAADVAHPGDEGEKAVLHDASSCEWFSVFSTFYHVARGL